MRLWDGLVGRRPIGTRLVLAVAVAMTAVLVLSAAFVYWRVSFALNRQLDQDLAAWRTVLVRTLVSGAATPRDTPGQTFQVYDERGRLVGGNPSVGRLASTRRVEQVLSTGPEEYDVGALLSPRRRAYRVRADRVRTTDGVRVLVAAISRRNHDEALRELLLQLAIADLVALAAASFVGYRTARAALDPVEDYRRAAEQAEATDFGRLPVAEGRDDELSRLGHTFNELLGRIEASALRERQFLADAAHELRTPLTVMSTDLQWAAARRRSGEELSEVLDSLRAQVDRLTRLANALLDLEELQAVGPLRREPTDLRRLLTEAVRDETDSEVVVESPEATVWVNPRWISIAVANLVRNALRHGAPPVRVVATYDAPTLRVVVRDAGPGFPADFRPVAFDRFSRPDSSRSTPGSGLGLHLVQSVAVAHGGSARILEGPGGGVEMVVDASPERSTGAREGVARVRA